MTEVEQLRSELAQYKCPIGLDRDPDLCSAGSCTTCLRLRVLAERERMYVALAKVRLYIEGHILAGALVSVDGESNSKNWPTLAQFIEDAMKCSVKRTAK